MQEHYEMIKRARAVLLSTPESALRESTAADYLRKVRRLRSRCKDHGGGLFESAGAGGRSSRGLSGMGQSWYLKDSTTVKDFNRI